MISNWVEYSSGTEYHMSKLYNERTAKALVYKGYAFNIYSMLSKPKYLVQLWISDNKWSQNGKAVSIEIFL